MNDIEKRIGIILTDPELHYAGGLPDTKGMISKITTLYHQLLSEERKRLIGEVKNYFEEAEMRVLLGSGPVEEDDSYGTFMRTKDALLATLNKEKD